MRRLDQPRCDAAFVVGRVCAYSTQATHIFRPINRHHGQTIYANVPHDHAINNRIHAEKRKRAWVDTANQRHPLGSKGITKPHQIDVQHTQRIDRVIFSDFEPEVIHQFLYLLP